MKKSLLFIVTLAISLTLCIAALTEASMTCSLNVEYDYEAAEKLLEIMNSYRESGDAWVLDSKGTKVSLGTLPPLVLDETLTDAAMQRASELVISFSHTRPDGSMCTTVNKAVTAENVGTFYSSPEAMFSAFAEENQPYANQGHRRNMLNSKYAYVGIGAIRYNGRWYWSMDFSYRAPQTEKVPERRTNDTPAVITVNPDSPEIKQSVATSVSYLQVHEGETVSLPAVYLVMGSARVEEVEDAVWTVSAPSVADVRGKQITGLKTGNTTVQYTANGVSRSITVSVLSAPVATATAAPTATPTGAPTSTPTPKPTPTPTPVPTPTPTPVPTPTPTPEPTIKVNFDLEGRQILHLPANLQEIGAEAFSGLACEAVIIPDSCTTIGERAFAGCDQLLYVYIPTSVTNISADAFDGCDNAVFEYEPCQHTNMVRTEYVAPTCTSDGYERTECADCHGNKTRTILNATGHNYVMHVVRAATIDEDGENQYVCQNCGATYSVPTVCYDETPTPAPTPTPTPEPTPTPKPPCQHTNMVRTAYVAPTCTSDGYEDTECADCHGNKTRTYLNATGHNYVMHVVRVATIDENGENQYVCQNCGDTYSVITVCYDE